MRIINKTAKFQIDLPVGGPLPSKGETIIIKNVKHYVQYVEYTYIDEARPYLLPTVYIK